MNEIKKQDASGFSIISIKPGKENLIEIEKDYVKDGVDWLGDCPQISEIQSDS